MLLTDWQVVSAILQLVFLRVFAPKLVRISVQGGVSAATVDLQGVAFVDYLACENYYQGFLYTQSLDCLNDMAHLLYLKLSEKAV